MFYFCCLLLCSWFTFSEPVKFCFYISYFIFLIVDFQKGGYFQNAWWTPNIFSWYSQNMRYFHNVSCLTYLWSSMLFLCFYEMVTLTMQQLIARKITKIANILALRIPRFHCVLCCNKQWSHWHVFLYCKKSTYFLLTSSVL